MATTIIGLDTGTTGVTALLYSVDRSSGLKPLLRSYREFPQHFPKPGWVEHHAADILGAVDEVLAELLNDPRASNVVGLGVTNQRETVFAMDRSEKGRALAPGIVWQDRRTDERCRQLASESGRATWIRERTGLVIDPYFSASKIEWLLLNVPGLSTRAHRGEVVFGTVDTLVLAHLTEGRMFATDPTNASRTMLFDIHRREWDGELCDLFGVDPQWLPEVRNSRGAFGQTSTEVVGRKIPILAVMGDQQAALFGQGATEPGSLKCTFGTGIFLLFNHGESSPQLSGSGLLATLAVGPQGQSVYALEGSIFMGGAIIQWLRDELGILNSSEESEEVAAGVPDTGGVTLVPAFTGLGAPYWDAEARAAILGLSRGSNRAHIVRAGLEAIALQTAELIELLRQETGHEIKSMRVDGGATSNNLLMQMQADLACLLVERPESIEATARGAALLAAVELGLVSQGAAPQVERTFVPNQSVSQATQLAKWRAAVARIRS